MHVNGTEWKLLQWTHNLRRHEILSIKPIHSRSGSVVEIFYPAF